MISPEERYQKKRATVKGRSMAYVEVGEGDPILFLHGNPSSSYLWRNVIPHLERLGRCIAPDLIGMGDSEKLEPSGPDRYRFVEHREYLDGLFDELGVDDNVTFVVHDWGGGLAFDWAMRHPGSVKAIAYMEAIVQPMIWDDFRSVIRPVFEGFRSPKGESMVLENNVFVEQVLPGGVLRDLTEAEMEVYRRPYLEPGESRRPTLTWPRELPMEGKPEEITAIVKAYAEWLARSDVPKLLISAEPGAIITDRHLEFCRTFRNQTEVTVRGVHFLQEDCPDEIGKTTADWLESLG